MGEENKFIVFIASILLVAAYICGIVMTVSDIQTQRRRYVNKSSGVISNKLINFLERERNTVITFGGILFPLYWCFVGGCFFGKRIYEVLIDNNDENRIASWVV